MLTSEHTPLMDLTEQDLEALGYSVVWFRGGRGCVVWDEIEHWTGAGDDQADALRASVTAMLPSRAARDAVAAIISARRAEARAGSQLAEPATACAEPSSAPSTVEPSPVVRDAEPVEVVASCAVPEEVLLAPAPPPTPDLSSHVNAVQAVIEQIDGIAASVTAAEPELAMMAPELQRLQIFLWVVRARAAAEPFVQVDAATRRMRSLASHLGRLARYWWPGAIDALRLTTDPARSLRSLVTTDEFAAARPQTWGEAADAVELVLAERLTRIPFDDGWSDTRTPGSEATAADADVERARLDVARALADNDGGEKRLAVLLDAARRLRSVRRSVTNTAGWAAVVGTLRRCASQAPGRYAALLHVLDPATVPAESWAHELRHERRPQAEAALRAAHSTEQLACALIAGFDVMDTPALATTLANRGPEVDRVTDDMLPDERRARRRLIQLKRSLTPSTDGSDVCAQDSPEVAAPPAAESPLRRAVRERVAGKSVLFVANREDPELRAALEQSFGCIVIWYVAEPRRIAAAQDKIAAGGCDLVLAATGFLDHATDLALSRAASAAGAPYLRVNRGRVLACEQAFAREFGLTQARAA